MLPTSLLLGWLKVHTFVMFSGILHGITHNGKSAEACADKNAEITCKSYMGKSCHFREYSSNNKYFDANIEVYVFSNSLNRGTE